ncbi:hypothetical protein SDC9_139626 [bioreactor metagenome]|uniref:Uncharacterized protein n=1 Tax=bioreactor metagenome TaxID=1076179 RepID=A0A645DT41_9ZZZZ
MLYEENGMRYLFNAIYTISGILMLFTLLLISVSLRNLYAFLALNMRLKSLAVFMTSYTYIGGCAGLFFISVYVLFRIYPAHHRTVITLFFALLLLTVVVHLHVNTLQLSECMQNEKQIHTTN